MNFDGDEGTTGSDNRISFSKELQEEIAAALEVPIWRVLVVALQPERDVIQVRLLHVVETGSTVELEDDPELEVIFFHTSGHGMVAEFSQAVVNLF